MTKAANIQHIADCAQASELVMAVIEQTDAALAFSQNSDLDERVQVDGFRKHHNLSEAARALLIVSVGDEDIATAMIDLAHDLLD